METISIRPLTDGDVEAACRLFFDSVRQGTKSHYNDSQRRAWAPQVPATSRWTDRLKSQTAFVAEERGEVIGFMTLKPDGYIDLAYVAPGFIGKGVAKRLYASIELAAKKRGIRRLHSEASYLARGLFERHGWSVVREQMVSRRGVSITNFVMEKYLP